MYILHSNIEFIWYKVKEYPKEKLSYVLSGAILWIHRDESYILKSQSCSPYGGYIHKSPINKGNNNRNKFMFVPWIIMSYFMAYTTKSAVGELYEKIIKLFQNTFVMLNIHNKTNTMSTKVSWVRKIEHLYPAIIVQTENYFQR